MDGHALTNEIFYFSINNEKNRAFLEYFFFNWVVKQIWWVRETTNYLSFFNSFFFIFDNHDLSTELTLLVLTL